MLLLSSILVFVILGHLKLRQFVNYKETDKTTFGQNNYNIMRCKRIKGG